MNDYVVRSDIQDSDQIAGKRGSSTGAESLWTWLIVKTASTAAAVAAVLRAQYSLAGGTALQKGKDNYDTLSAGRTLTISGTPADGDVTNVNLTVTTSVTLAFPAARRVGGATSGLITALVVPAGNHEFSFKRIGSVFWLADSVGDTTETAA